MGAQEIPVDNAVDLDAILAERRRAWRFSSTYRVEYDIDGRRSLSYVNDLSRGGMSLRSAKDLEPGQKVSFRVSLSDDLEPLSMTGTVRNAREGEDSQLVGIEWASGQSEAFGRLSSFLEKTLLPDLEKTVKQGRASGLNFIELVELYRELGRNDDALALYKSLHERHGRDSDVQQHMARFLFQWVSEVDSHDSPLWNELADIVQTSLASRSTPMLEALNARVIEVREEVERSAQETSRLQEELRIKMREQEEARHKEELERMRAEGSELRLAAKEAQEQMEALRAAEAETARQLDLERIEIEQLRHERDAALQAVTEQEEQQEKNQTAIENQRAELDRQARELQRLSEELPAAEAKRKEIERANAELLERREQLTGDQEPLKAFQRELVTANEELVTANEELKAHKEDLARQKAELQDEVDLLQQRDAELRERQAVVAAETTKAAELLRQAEMLEADVNTRAAELQKATEVLADRLAKRSSQLEATIRQLRQREQQLETVEAANGELRMQLEAKPGMGTEPLQAEVVAVRTELEQHRVQALGLEAEVVRQCDLARETQSRCEELQALLESTQQQASLAAAASEDASEQGSPERAALVEQVAALEGLRDQQEGELEEARAHRAGVDPELARLRQLLEEERERSQASEVELEERRALLASERILLDQDVAALHAWREQLLEVREKVEQGHSELQQEWQRLTTERANLEAERAQSTAAGHGVDRDWTQAQQCLERIGRELDSLRGHFSQLTAASNVQAEQPQPASFPVVQAVAEAQSPEASPQAAVTQPVTTAHTNAAAVDIDEGDHDIVVLDDHDFEHIDELLSDEEGEG